MECSRWGSSVDSQVQHELDSTINSLNPLRLRRAKPGPKPEWIRDVLWDLFRWKLSKIFSCSEEQSRVLKSSLGVGLLMRRET